MRAIIIDTDSLCVREAQIPAGESELATIYNEIGCQLITSAGNVPGKKASRGRGKGRTRVNTLFVDDEGLYTQARGFISPLFPTQPFFGTGVILGAHVEVESVDCDLTLDEVREGLQWFRR